MCQAEQREVAELEYQLKAENKRAFDLERQLESKARDLQDALKSKKRCGERWKHHQAVADCYREALVKAKRLCLVVRTAVEAEQEKECFPQDYNDSLTAIEDLEEALALFKEENKQWNST